MTTAGTELSVQYFVLVIEMYLLEKAVMAFRALSSCSGVASAPATPGRATPSGDAGREKEGGGRKERVEGRKRRRREERCIRKSEVGDGGQGKGTGEGKERGGEEGRRTEGGGRRKKGKECEGERVLGVIRPWRCGDYFFCFVSRRSSSVSLLKTQVSGLQVQGKLVSSTGRFLGILCLRRLRKCCVAVRLARTPVQVP